MDEEKNNRHTSEDSNKEPELHWWGLQFYSRAKGTNEIIQRSFPFWAPSIDFANDHAKKSNRLAKEERTYWTHISVKQHLVETKDGSHEEKLTETEVKIK